MAGSETFTEKNDSFVLGGFPVLTRPRTIASGAGVLKRGTVLGQITASKKFVKALAASDDGSQNVKEILAADVDASASDVIAPTYVSGEFDQTKLIYGTGITEAAAAEALEGTTLFLTKPLTLQS
tara:strand:- start:354 stop:728 length:375 start_codon:yes stop_codon:yes gene_type:complete